MKDEIKKILEDVKRHLDYVETTKQCSIRDNEMKAMYDHITNLQEENEHLQKQNKGLNNLIIQHIDEEDNLIDYKSRNEKAKKYNKEVLTWWTNEEITDEIANENLKILNEIII